MKRLAGLCLLLLLITAAGCGPFHLSKVYKLWQVIPHADIDYKFIKNIDKIEPPYPAGGQYQIGDIKTTPGRFTVFKFMSVCDGQSSSGKKQKFHELIVLKVDYLTHKVVDAYHYTLEWSDQPSLDLYRARRTGMKLKSGLRINDLGLANSRGQQLEEKAYLCLKKCRYR